jgi:SAM-dependent methyltransferase
MTSRQRAANRMTTGFEQYADGKTLYGDDFSSDQIDAWFRAEAEAYYRLPEERAPGVYAYHARNWRHGFRHLPSQPFEHILCLGGAYGDELRPILDRAKKVTILEPAGEFQVPRFEYVKPDISGRMPFADDSFDLVTCFGVLHHIPNVSTVVREMARCTRSKGWQLICEPSHSMGNWDKPRRLLTPHERGIPPAILRRIVEEAGLQIVRERRCMFSLTSRLQFLLSKKQFVFNTKWITVFDDYVSNLPIWSESYHATNLIQKLRPWAMFLVLRKDREGKSVLPA